MIQMIDPELDLSRDAGKFQLFDNTLIQSRYFGAHMTSVNVIKLPRRQEPNSDLNCR